MVSLESDFILSHFLDMNRHGHRFNNDSKIIAFTKNKWISTDADLFHKKFIQWIGTDTDLIHYTQFFVQQILISDSTDAGLDNFTQKKLTLGAVDMLLHRIDLLLNCCYSHVEASTLNWIVK